MVCEAHRGHASFGANLGGCWVWSKNRAGSSCSKSGYVSGMPKNVSPRRIRQTPEYSRPDRWASLCAYQGQPRMHTCLWGFDVHQSQSPDVAKSWNNLPKVSWAHLSNTRQAGKISDVAGCGCAISLRNVQRRSWPLRPVLDPEAGQQVSSTICPLVLSCNLWRTVDQCESAWLSKTLSAGDELALFGFVSETALKRGPQMHGSATESLPTKMPKCLCRCICKPSKEDLDYSKFTAYFWNQHQHTYLFNLLNEELKYQCGENS